MIDTYTADPEFQSLCINTGDFTDNDTETEWQDEYFNPSYSNNVQMFREVPYAGARGNHETYGDNLMPKFYRFPYYSDTFYYAYEYGPALIIVLDTEISISSGSAQYNWLENQLQSTGKKWIFIACHRPGYEAGTHSANNDIRYDVQDLCVQYGVDAVFAGHNHHYVRISQSGVQHITTGGGGAPLYSYDPGVTGFQAGSQTWHHCEVTIACDQLTIKAKKWNGEILDVYTKTDSSIICGGVPEADFTASPTIAGIGESVSFTDISTGSPTSWSWSFPGGTPASGTAQNPSVTYAAEGTYDVTLTVTNAEGSDVETKTGYITVIENPTTFTLTTAVSGEGTVSPAGGTFTEGTAVNIEAVPSAGYVFNGWGGDLSGSTNPTTITMDADKHVNAAFIFSTGGNYLPFPISSSSDDAEEDESDTTMYLVSTDLEMVDESGSSDNRQLVGLRFTGLTIPKGVNITGAYIQFTCDDDNTGSTSLTIKAEDTDNSPAFTSGPGNISGRTTTSASVSWSPPAWTTIGESGAAQQTPDISSLIQEVIDRPGYSYGNPVTIIITGSGEREAESYDGTAAPVLYIKAESSTPQPPVADFSADQTTIVEGQAVNFTDLSTNAPTSRSWTFAGGTPASSTAQNPSVTYDTAGTYDVTLTVGNSAGSDTKTKTDYITVQVTLPTVGNTQVFPQNSVSANRRAMPFTMPEDGTITRVTMYHTGGSGSMILGVYDGTSSAPANLLAASPVTGVNGTTGWQTINLTDPVFVPGGGIVWLAWVYETNPGIAYDDGTPGRVDAGEAWTGSMPSSFGSAAQADFIYSIYASYTTTPPVRYTLTTNTSGNGSVSPSGGTYNAGTNVTLTATPDANWVFSGWSGDASGTSNPTTIVMDADKNVTAAFVPWVPEEFTLNATTSGNGTVSLDPPPTNGTYTEGTGVCLTAAPDSGYEFTGWSGDASGTSNPLCITMDADKNITANFAEIGLENQVGITTVLSQTTTTANLRAMPFTMPENGVIDSVTMYHAGGSGQMLLAVYDGEGSPDALLSATWRETVSSTTGWQTLNLVSPVYAAGGSTVWLAWTYESNPGIAYESGTPGRAHSEQLWLGTVPVTFGDCTFADYVYSIYATYTPVTGSLGETGRLGSTTTTANRRAMPFTMSEDGTVESLSMYHVGSQNSGSDSMILAVYSDSGNAPGNKLGQTPVTAVSLNTHWQTIDLESPVFVASGTKVWLAWVYESNPGIYFTDGTPGRADAGEGWTGSMPANFGSSTQANYVYSIYAVYK
jgi:uncharacterized repeat protein (TIGR02543 family)